MRTYITLVALMLFSSCTNPQDNGDNNVAIAKKMFDAFNEHQWQVMADIYIDSASFLDPSFGKDYVTQSRAAVVEKYTGFQEAFPNIHDEVVGMYPSGDKVTVEFVSTGTSADGISFKLPIVTVLTFNNGLIVKDATYYDLENP